MTTEEVLYIAEPKMVGWNKRQKAHFLSQTGHESLNYTLLEESLNYSANSLAATWPNRYRGPDGKPNALAIKIQRNKVAIGNNTYANRMGNGSVESGEGYKYRGRGILQVTGKENYRECSKALFNDEKVLLDNPDLLLQPEHAVNSALWYWEKRKLKNIDDIKVLTKKINGGLKGLDDRAKRFDKLIKIL